MVTVRRAKRKVPKVVLTVEWDPGRERYVTFNPEHQVAGLSSEINMAIGGARIEANRLREQGNRVVVMVKDRNNGKLREEYTAEPAPVDSGGSGEVRYRKQSSWRRPS